MRIGVVTCDTVRAGGVEQLKAFTDLLKVPLKKANGAAELRKVLSEMDGFDQILIDTPGINPFDKEQVRKLARLLAAADMQSYLVLPGGTDTEESSEMARVFSAVGVYGIIPTRIDIARRLGGILSAAQHGNLVFSDVSNTPKVAEGLNALTPKTLSRLLMPKAFRSRPEQNSLNKTSKKTARSGRH
jgi:flagellar biosynthesis protein FlhF